MTDRRRGRCRLLLLVLTDPLGLNVGIAATRKFRANPCFFPAPKTGGGIVTPASPQPPLTPTEQAFVSDMEQFEGRKLSPTKARWYVDQAKAFGELREPDLPPQEQPLTDQAAKLIANLERFEGRMMTPEEAGLSLEQAREIGHI
jgi:hypothetical protein